MGWNSKKKKTIDFYCDKLSRFLIVRVIAAPWVEGVEDYLSKHYKSQNFFLVTATPYEGNYDYSTEITYFKFFIEIKGAPTKRQLLKNLLNKYKLRK